MGLILALAAIIFFGLGYWFAYGNLGRKRNSSVAARERKFIKVVRKVILKMEMKNLK